MVTAALKWNCRIVGSYASLFIMTQASQYMPLRAVYSFAKQRYRQEHAIKMENIPELLTIAPNKTQYNEVTKVEAQQESK